MTDPHLPDGAELDRAIRSAKSGALAAPDFATALADATVMLAVTSRPTDDAVDPFVISVDGVDHGVVFTGPRTYERFTASTPFVLLPGRDLGRSWPAGLGLAINPGDEPSMLIGPADLRALVRGDAPTEAPTVVPAGSRMKIGAPDPGLPEAALELLRRVVRSDAGVYAAYQLAVAVGDGPVELVVGVEAQQVGVPAAESLAARVLDADPGFRGLAFLDLDGRLLSSAREHSRPLR